MTRRRVQISPSLEDYLEAVLELSSDDQGARTTDIATKLDVSKASVNQAVGLLVGRHLVTREKYGPIFLTDEGVAAAQTIRKRHEAIKSFLTNVLGVSEAIAEEDACRIEHVVSAKTMASMIDYMDKRTSL
ncbi:MAG: metal-dependent transcriptional regulator [Limnochordia bacterium]|jgi:DtxR family Mn-dependent transcriptional regulator